MKIQIEENSALKIKHKWIRWLMTIDETHLMQGRVVANGLSFRGIHGATTEWCMKHGWWHSPVVFKAYIHQIDYSYLGQLLGWVKIFQCRVL